MICQKCGLKNASVHITKIYNSKKTELNLCRDCAEEYTGRVKEPTINIGFPHMGLDDLISGFFGMSTVENISNQHRKTQDKCEYCSTTLDEIRETGRVGCAMCYKIFKDSLHPIIKKVHGSTQHVGHAPEGLTQDVTVNKEQFIEEKKNPVEDQINILKDEMKNAIKLEDYEQAAVLRDRIRLLEENVSGGEIT